MEMELGRKHLDLLKTAVDTCVGHEETSDMIVPDASPDIMRILGAFGDVYLKDEIARENQYTINGMISGWVLYVSEGDHAVRRLEISMPFMHTFDSAEIDSDTVGCVRLSLSALEAREINPRKVTVRANVAICLTAYAEEHAEFLCSIEDAEIYGVQYRTEPISVFAPIDVVKKNFILSDDVEIPESKPNFASMLKYDACLALTDSKIIGSKAVIKGIANLKCVYISTDGEVISFDRELPYSQIVESDSLDENCVLDVQMQMGDMKLDAQHDMSGDVHYLALNMPIKMCVTVSAQNKIDPIVDLYSTRYPLDTRFEESEITQRTDSISKRVTMSESMPCDVPIDRVIDVSVRTEPAHKRLDAGEPALANGVFINVLYLDHEGTLASVNRRFEAVCPIPSVNHEYDAKTVIDGIGHSIDPGNEITVRFSVDYDITEQDCCKIRALEQLHADTAAPIDMSSAPSVVVRRINQGDTLWKLAKQHRTTVSEIMTANKMETGDLTEGDMILIPLKRR